MKTSNSVDDEEYDDRPLEFGVNGPRPVRPLPPEMFSDEYWNPPGCPDPETRGRRSTAVEGRLAASCAGWAERPTPEEFHEAAAAANPTARQRAIVGALLDEGEPIEVDAAFMEGAFTWRGLVRVMRARNGGAPHRMGRHINVWTAENLRLSRPHLERIWK